MIIEFEYQPLIEDFKKNGDMLLSSILKILENSGNKHSDNADDNILEGSNNGKTWVLTDWLLEVVSYPKYGDKILAKTWSEFPVGFGCNRDFELYCNGKLAVKGLTKWILLDLVANRPCKVPQELIDQYQPEDRCVFADTKMPRLSLPEAFDSETPIQVRRSDFDFNNHVHNLVYVDYALEALPKAVYDSRDFRSIRINYKQAVKQDEQISCKYAEVEGKHICCIFGSDGSLKTQIELK